MLKKNCKHRQSLVIVLRFHIVDFFVKNLLCEHDTMVQQLCSINTEANFTTEQTSLKRRLEWFEVSGGHKLISQKMWQQSDIVILLHCKSPTSVSLLATVH